MKVALSLCLIVFLILGPMKTAAGGKDGKTGRKMFHLHRMQINNVDMPITNYGEFGQSEVHTAGCYWPRGSGHRYIFGAGIWIGALVNGDTLVSCGYNTVGRGCDLCPGPPEHGHDHYMNNQSHPEDRLYFSTDPTDFEEWPLRDSLGNQVSAVFGTTDNWAHEEVWCEYHDSVPEFHEWEPGTYPLGLVVKQIAFAWNAPMNENMIFFLYEFENVSGDTIRDMYVGHAADDDVGWADDDLLGCDVERSLVWCYTLGQEAGWDPDISTPPYYVGKILLLGPKADDTIYVSAADLSDPDYPNVFMDTIYPGERIPLTSYNRCTRGYDADVEWKRYSMLAGYNIETFEYDPWQGVVDIVPGDKRMVMGCGPFEMAPGEVDTCLIAVMFSSGNVGGLDYLKEQGDIAECIASAIADPSMIQVIYPNGGEEISGVQTVTWTSENVDSVDLYLSPDSGETWSILAADLDNTGSYEWNTQTTPDGFCFFKVCGHPTCLPRCDQSDGEFIVNNPGNGSPQTRLLSPNGGETLGGVIEINWWARDPDGDDIFIDLYYSNDDGSSFLPIAIDIPNSGSHLCNTDSFPNGTECIIKVEATDGALISYDCSDATFSIFNTHEPAGQVEHVAGGCNTVGLIPEIIREWELLAHTYDIRFSAHKFDTLTNKVVYTYEIYDLTSDIIVLENQEFHPTMDGTPTIHYSPLFNGISLRIEVAVDSTTFNPDSISVSIGEYVDDLQIYGWFVPSIAEWHFTTPECKIWAFRGEGLIEIEWSKMDDTLTAEVFDMVNNREILPDTALGDSWCFGGYLPFQAPKIFLTQGNVTAWFYVCGVRYLFNGGARMTSGGFASIDSGDVWLLHNCGDRPPLDGDIYRFRSVGLAESSVPQTGFSLGVNLPNPFSHSTTITYCIPSQLEVFLVVYDIAGRRVKKLVHGTRKTGPHIVTWNGDDDSGRKVSQGVYFYRLSAHTGSATYGFTSTKKMIFLH